MEKNIKKYENKLKKVKLIGIPIILISFYPTINYIINEKIDISILFIIALFTYIFPILMTIILYVDYSKRITIYKGKYKFKNKEEEIFFDDNISNIEKLMY